MNEDFYINLIYKKLSDEISPSELEDLEKWRQSSETNQQIFKDVETVWEVSDDLPLNTNLEVDLDKDFAVLEERIQKEEKTNSPPKMKVLKSGSEMGAGLQSDGPKQEKPIDKQEGFRFKRLFAVAASIALVLASSLLLWNFFGTSNPVNQIATSVEGEHTLPDLSKVYLNKESSIDYPAQFVGKERRVKLEGEAFFKVTHEPSKPFVIETLAEEITVLGTSFYVKAHDKSSTAIVEVVTGKVELKTKKDNQKLILMAGDRARYDRQSKKLLKGKKEGNNEFAWHNKKLQFVETPISKAVEEIEELYGVNLAVENEALNKCLFTSKFEKAELSTVLETISGVLGLEVERIDRKNYKLKGGACQ